VIYEEGGFSHLYNRGCNKDLIFKEKSDYENLIQRIVGSDFNKYLSIISYCLMPNHYHFLLQQKTEKPISDWIRYIFSGYTQYFNHRYSRSGTLFEGRVRSRLITNEQYLIRSSLYIHHNPVAAGLVSRPELWQFSNYHEWIGLRKSKLCDYNFIHENFDSEEDYLKRMNEYLEGKVFEIEDLEIDI
jgi:putative transposase